MDEQQRIREIAYRAWEDEGRPEGQAHRHWITAEQQMSKDPQRTQPAPESDESAERAPVAIRTVRGKSGSSAPASPANPETNASVGSK